MKYVVNIGCFWEKEGIVANKDVGKMRTEECTFLERKRREGDDEGETGKGASRGMKSINRWKRARRDAKREDGGIRLKTGGEDVLPAGETRRSNGNKDDD